MEQEEFLRIRRSRPHLVILGAGASIEAIVDGDKNGRHISAMNNFLKELKLEDILSECSLSTQSNNLEDIYSELNERPEYENQKNKLEFKISTMFKKYQLPDKMTVYDYLVISLRNKDLIASFNWDPLLIQAYERMSKITTNLPELVFLHGNVLAGYCVQCKAFGRIENNCPLCNKPFSQSKLLYPIKNKDYEKDPFISEQWLRVKKAIGKASIVTFFGYSAPKTDQAAISLLKNKYNEGPIHRFDLVEIIDIENENILKERWKHFVLVKGAQPPIYMKSFYESYLAKYPRRSIESYVKNNFEAWQRIVANEISENGMSFSELKAIIDPLIEEERNL